MIFIGLILGVVIFAFSMIFMKKSVWQWVLIIVGIILIGFSEIGIIMNDRYYFGMEQQIDERKEDIKSEEYPPVLLTEEKGGVVFYHFINAADNSEAVSTRMGKITIRKGYPESLLKIKERKVVYKNRFFQWLFFLQHKNGEVIYREFSFDLTNDWQIK